MRLLASQHRGMMANQGTEKVITAFMCLLHAQGPSLSALLSMCQQVAACIV